MNCEQFGGMMDDGSSNPISNLIVRTQHYTDSLNANNFVRCALIGCERAHTTHAFINFVYKIEIIK